MGPEGAPALTVRGLSRTFDVEGPLDADFIARIFLRTVTLILSVTVHEFSHAFAADKLGDGLPASEGRLTLNPLAHIDPIGTLLLPAMVGFGWGRPVRTQPINYTRRFSMRAGEALVSFAGPLANAVMAILCGALWAILHRADVITIQSPFHMLLQMMVQLNLVLFVLNLLPFPPLDGSKIAAWVFGYKADKVLDLFASMGTIGLIVVIFVAGSFISWVANHAYYVILGGFSSLLS